MTGGSVPFAEQGFRMAHMGGKVHGEFVVRVSGNDVEISEECSTHAVDVEYSGLVPSINDWATVTTNNFAVPHPSFRINWFTNRTKQTK